MPSSLTKIYHTAAIVAILIISPHLFYTQVRIQQLFSDTEYLVTGDGNNLLL